MNTQTYKGERVDQLFTVIGVGTMLFIIGFMVGSLIATLGH